MNREPPKHMLQAMKSTRESVRIRVHGVDGAIHTFTQYDDTLIRQTLDWLRPTSIFKQQRIEIPGAHSLTTFIAAQVSRIDILAEPRSRWIFPSELVEAVELTEPEFRALANGEEPPGTQKAAHPLKNTAFVLIDIALTGGHYVFLAKEPAGPRPAQNIENLGAVLPTTSFAFLLRTGGVAVLNIAKLLCFTVYRDRTQVSAAVWTSRQSRGAEFGIQQQSSGFRRFGEQAAAQRSPSERTT
jgi:hypothetical protein